VDEIYRKKTDFKNGDRKQNSRVVKAGELPKKTSKVNNSWHGTRHDRAGHLKRAATSSRVHDRYSKRKNGKKAKKNTKKHYSYGSESEYDLTLDGEGEGKVSIQDLEALGDY